MNRRLMGTAGGSTRDAASLLSIALAWLYLTSSRKLVFPCEYRDYKFELQSIPPCESRDCAHPARRSCHDGLVTSYVRVPNGSTCPSIWCWLVRLKYLVSYGIPGLFGSGTVVRLSILPWLVETFSKLWHVLKQSETRPAGASIYQPALRRESRLIDLLLWGVRSPARATHPNERWWSMPRLRRRSQSWNLLSHLTNSYRFQNYNRAWET